MKKIILGVFALMGATSFSQENGYFFGGLESNMQWLLDDEKFDFPAPEEHFRANNYLQLNYSLGKFTAGVQYESYLPVALSGYSPTWDSQNGIGTYYLNFKNETCYTFTVNDSFGDGGSRVTVTDTDGVQLYRALGN